MSRRKPIAVQCPRNECGWKGRRVRRECECDNEGYPTDCACTWGRCPKCGFKVRTAYDIRETIKNSAAAEKWWQEFGEAEMEQLNTVFASKEETGR